MPTLIKGRRIVHESPLPPDAVVIRLQPHEDPATVADRLGAAARVEIHFPKFGDGRGFSLARLLRERYGYQGELRAVGDVFRDQLFYMESCGFDAFELRDGEDARAALPWFEKWGQTPFSGNRGQSPIFSR